MLVANYELTNYCYASIKFPYAMFAAVWAIANWAFAVTKDKSVWAEINPISPNASYNYVAAANY